MLKGQEQGKATYIIIRILSKVNDFMFLDPVVRKFSILLETLCALKAALKLLSPCRALPAGEVGMDMICNVRHSRPVQKVHAPRLQCVDSSGIQPMKICRIPASNARFSNTCQTWPLFTYQMVHGLNHHRPVAWPLRPWPGFSIRTRASNASHKA